MLWELEELETRRAEIEAELAELKASRLSAKVKLIRIAELSREDTAKAMRRQQLLSYIEKDRQLSKALDEKRQRSQMTSLPEAQMGVAESPGQPTPAQAQRAKLQARQRAWHEKSVTERSIESAKVLEQERDHEWEPD